MSPLSDRSLGVVIAYLLPGFTSLWAIAPFVPTVAGWLDGSVALDHGPTVGGFLYVTTASLIAGLVLNVMRWAIFDALNTLTGVQKPQWDDGKLQENFDAFHLAVDHHYRYYQFYACMMIAVAMLYGVHRFILREPIHPLIDLVVLIFFVLFAFAQRDALKRYFSRASHILDSQRKNYD